MGKSPTANKIAMFEKQQKEKDEKAKKPVKKVNKMKVGKLNSKFGGLNINPAAMKPGGGRATISNKHNDDGSIDHQPKVEQATISKGKRRKRKKKSVALESVNKEEEEKEKLIAPPMFYD